jgi:hypothetical protein
VAYRAASRNAQFGRNNDLNYRDRAAGAYVAASHALTAISQAGRHYVSMPYWAKGGPPKMSGFVTNATSEDVFSPAA